MAVPVGTQVFEESMDPYDVADFEVDVKDLLQSGEGISSLTVSIPAESLLLGLTINNTGGYNTTITGTIIRFWLSILAQEQANTAFSGAGARLPIEVNLITDSVPPRKRQRTVAVQVVQR